MPIGSVDGYGLLDEDIRSNAFDDRNHYNAHIHRQRRNEETSRFPSRERDEMHHRGQHPTYEPPIPQDGNSRYVMRENPATSGSSDKLSDNEFISLATQILTSMEIGNVMKLNEREKSTSATIILQKTLPMETIKQFSDALDIRFRSMSKYPTWGESHHCTSVRRCEEMFGNELRILSQMNGDFLRDQDNGWPGDKRDDHLGHSAPRSQQTGMRTRAGPEEPYDQNENAPNINIPKMASSRGPESVLEMNSSVVDCDMTKHIVWENNPTMVSGLKKDASGETDSTAGETASHVSSHFNDSEVYEMVVDIEPKQGEHGLKKEASNSIPKNITNNDDDTRSVASLYSLSREKAFLSPDTKHRKFVSVKAPEALPGNFMFEARMNDEIFMVSVPEGGVKKGEVFKSPALNIESKSVFDPTGRTKRLTDMNTPAFQWRSGLFNIFANGIMHPMFLNSCFCTHVSLAQVMTRMHLDTAGKKTSSLRTRVHFNTVVIIPSVLAALHGILFFLMFRAFHLHLKSQLWIFIYSSIPILIADVALFGYFVYMTAKVRRLVRQEYNIQEDGCFDFRDELLSFFCAPLVVAQMGRHTADYDTYVGTFCTKTGLSDHVEVKLPSDDISCGPIGVSV